jgi:hypothetical protein
MDTDHSEPEREPEDVFTPRTPVSREMFVKRNEPGLDGHLGVQTNLRYSLRDRGGQVLVFGDTGVGKTSLVKYAAEDESMDFISIDCLSGRTYEEILIDKLVKSRETGGSNLTGGSAEVGSNLFGRLSGKHERKHEYELLKGQLIDSVVKAMDDAGAQLLVLDNFQNLTDEKSRTLVAEHIEIMSDHAADYGNKKLVIIGIADDAQSLLGGSRSFRRRTKEIGVPRMPDEEIKEILLNGFSSLQLEPDDDTIKQLVFYADGFPFFAHLLGLHVAILADEKRTREIRSDADLVPHALTRLVLEIEQSLRHSIKQAFEGGSASRVGVESRQNILTMLANSSGRDWSSGEVIEMYEREFQKEDSGHLIYNALREFAKPEFGKILQRTGLRSHYRYKFSDPYMRPLLRISESGIDVKNSLLRV